MLRNCLATLPPILDQTYGHMLHGINEEDSECSMCTLQWLTFSVQPLSVREVTEAVATGVVRDPAFDRDKVLEDSLEALNICTSLVIISMNNEQEGSNKDRQAGTALKTTIAAMQ